MESSSTDTALIDENTQATLDKSTRTTDDFLTKFADSTDFSNDILQTFGNSVEPTEVKNLQQKWASSDFTKLPTVEILPASELDGAKGAFSIDNNTIYLSQDFLNQNAANTSAITDVLLHEIGHSVESQVKGLNTGGETGAIFSALAQGHTLTPLELKTLKSENDTATVPLGGKQVTIEKDSGDYTGTNLNTLQAGLDKFLGTLQEAVDNQVLGNSLPLLGNTLKSSSNQAVQFINQLKTAFDSELAKLTNPTTDDLKKALQTAASSLGILKDLQEVDTADDVEYTLKLGQNPITFSTPLSSDIGLPNLGLKVTGNADTNLGYNFNLSFGLDKTKGFFLDTSQTDPLDLNLGVTIPNLDAAANLGLLQFKAKDEGTSFNGDFAINFKNTNPDNKLFSQNISAIGTNLVDATLKGKADIELNLGAITGVKGLPSISTDLSVKWIFDDISSADPTQLGSFGNIPAISFNNVTVDAGSAISDFIGPVLKEVQTVTEPLRPVVNVISSPLPVINSSIIQLAQDFGVASPDTDRFISKLSDIISLANSIPADSGDLKVNLGSFSFGTNDIRNSKASDIPVSASEAAVAAINAISADSGPAADFLNELQKNNPKDDRFKLDFPLLTDPNTAINLLLGKSNVTLFSFQPPNLYDDFHKSKFIPILGPFGIEFDLNAVASAGIQIGYDSTGLTEFEESNDPAKLFDGFYVSPPTGSGDPDRNHNVFLSSDIAAGAGIGTAVASLTVGGGIDSNIIFDLKDHTRASDFANKPVFSLFNPNGELDALLYGQIRLDFGFFSFTSRLDLADIKLIDFNPSNTSPNEADHYNVEDPTPDGELDAKLRGKGIIKRVGTKNSDMIRVTHKSGDENGEDLALTGLGPADGTYKKIKLVVISGGGGNDTINLTGIEAAGQLKGEAGNDTLIGGNGDDFLIGGGGNNFLDGGGGNNTADYTSAPDGVEVNLAEASAANGYGGVDTLVNIQNATGSKSHDNVLIAGDSNAVLIGGDANDTLIGGKGDDVLIGGTGKNYLDGGGGTNTVSYLTALGSVYVNLSSQNVGSDLPVISPIDGSPIYLTANHASGGNGVVDDTIKNIQNLQGSIYDSILVAGDAAPPRSKNGYSYTGSYISGLSGNDLIYAGPGSDVLDGDDGNNWVSYALSNAGVDVNLSPIKVGLNEYIAPTESGGYAQGDKLLPRKDDKGSFTNRSSFNNLEGSPYNDTLIGDDGDNIIRGGAGDDYINGGGGNDTLIGGTGADTLIGGGSGTLRADQLASAVANGATGGDIASYADSPGGVLVNLATGSGFYADAQGDKLSGIQNLLGSPYADTLIGDNQDNDFNPGLSGGGRDYVDGGGGTNSLTLDYSLGDYGTGVTGGITNPFTGSGSFARYTDNSDTKILDAVDFTNIQRLFITGTSHNDTIIGGPGDDVIFAGAGNDYVDGGAGNDYLDGGDGFDTLSDNLSNINDNISLKGIDPASPHEFHGINFSNGSLTIENFEVFKNINLGNGNNFFYQPGQVDNYITTGNGNNYINPGLGNDTVVGGTGDNTLVLDYSSGNTGVIGLFVLQYQDSKGKIHSDQQGQAYSYNESFVGYANHIDFTGINHFYEIGDGNKVNYLAGGDSNDTLKGGNLDDTLIGNRGNDVLIAGDGRSRLQGTNNFDYGYDVPPKQQPGSGGFGVSPTHVYVRPHDIDTLTGGAGHDTFILGDSSGAFYTQDPSTPGYPNAGNNDYALIQNFDPGRDTIELNRANYYSIGNSPTGLPIGQALYVGDANSSNLDLIAIIQEVQGALPLMFTGFNPKAQPNDPGGKADQNYYSFVGNPIPPGPK